MNYPIFENIFMKYCKKNFSLLTNDQEKKFKNYKNTAENIDKYILLPAGFNPDEIEQFLGKNLCLLSKDVLSGFRTGNTSLRDYIVGAYTNDNAVEYACNYFSHHVPLVMYSCDRLPLVKELHEAFKVNNGNYSLYFFIDDEHFFDFLARVFVYCISGNRSLIDFNENYEVSPKMEKVIRELDMNGVNDVVVSTLDTIMDGEYVFLRNDTSLYTKDGNRMTFIEILKMYLGSSGFDYEPFCPKLLSNEVFRDFIETGAEALREDNWLNCTFEQDGSIKRYHAFFENNNPQTVKFDFMYHSSSNEYYSETDILFFCISLLKKINKFDESHKYKARTLFNDHFNRRFVFLINNKGYASAMHFYQEIWELLHGPERSYIEELNTDLPLYLSTEFPKDNPMRDKYVGERLIKYLVYTETDDYE